jgi:hypothetical protein
VGFFLVFFGAKFLIVTVFIAGIMSLSIFSALVYFNIFDSKTNTSVWIVLSIGAVIGLALCYLLLKFTKIFFMIVGGFTGYTLGIFLYQLFLNYIHSNPEVVYWITIVSCIVLGALISLCIVKHVLIIGTSICGAYAVIRGFSLYIGHFPNESIIIDLVKREEWNQLEAVRLY